MSDTHSESDIVLYAIPEFDDFVRAVEKVSSAESFTRKSIRRIVLFFACWTGFALTQKTPEEKWAMELGGIGLTAMADVWRRNTTEDVTDDEQMISAFLGEEENRTADVFYVMKDNRLSMEKYLRLIRQQQQS